MPGMAGQDHPRFSIDDDPADEADGLDRPGEVFDLALGVDPAAPGARLQLVQRAKRLVGRRTVRLRGAMARSVAATTELTSGSAESTVPRYDIPDTAKER